MNSTAALYTRDVLALATSLAAWPMADDLPLKGSARSPACGSTIDLGIEPDANGRIARLGLLARACAIGQASAAIFARQAVGQDAAAILAARQAIEAWLGGAELPGWPGLESIAAARDFPARHGAILLPWRAALVALGTPG